MKAPQMAFNMEMRRPKTDIEEISPYPTVVMVITTFQMEVKYESNTFCPEL